MRRRSALAAASFGLGSRGPFYQCNETVHREPHQAAATPAPGGWWGSADEPPHSSEEPNEEESHVHE